MQLYVINRTCKNFSAYTRELIHARQAQDRLICKSYSGQAMALGVSNGKKVAIDIEEEKYRDKETILFFYNKFRTFGLSNIPEEASAGKFYQHWTAMESYLKLQGYGFRSSKGFCIDLNTGTVRVGDHIVAYLNYVRVRKYLICLCGRQEWTNSEPDLHCFGWSDSDE